MFWLSPALSQADDIGLQGCSSSRRVSRYLYFDKCNLEIDRCLQIGLFSVVVFLQIASFPCITRLRLVS